MAIGQKDTRWFVLLNEKGQAVRDKNGEPKELECFADAAEAADEDTRVRMIGVVTILVALGDPAENDEGFGH